MTKAKLLHDIKVLEANNIDVAKWVSAIAHCGSNCHYHNATNAFDWGKTNDLMYWRAFSNAKPPELIRYTYKCAPSTQEIVLPLLKDIYLDTHPEYFL